MSEIAFKPVTKFAFVFADDGNPDWARFLSDTEDGAWKFGGKWKGRVVRVEITAQEVSPETGDFVPFQV